MNPKVHKNRSSTSSSHFLVLTLKWLSGMKTLQLATIFSINLFVITLLGETHVRAEGLGISKNRNGRAILTYMRKPVFAFGPSPQQILTFLPRGNGNDYKDWISWAKKYGITHVRSYPSSFIADVPAINIFKLAEDKRNKYDLTKFNKEYFQELRNACKVMRENGIIVHLQLWQAVSWKKSWGRCYYNPRNHINPDISAHAGPGEFVTMRNKTLLDHQKRYVKKILNATGDLGNVFYDIMNEIGNGTGTSEEWVWEIIRTINEWEVRNGVDVLITLNDEGGMRMGKFSLKCPGLDLIIKDLGRYDEHVKAQAEYGKPTISVRNIDYDYEKRERLYFYGKYNLEVNTDPELQTRGRKYWWRMFMAGVQIAGGYADAHHKRGIKWFSNRVANKVGVPPIFELKYKPSYRMNTESESNFFKFKKFINLIREYETLIPSTNVLLSDYPEKNSYILQSNKQALIYIESPNGRAGFSYYESQVKLTGLSLSDGTYNGLFYFPRNGKTEHFSVLVKDGAGCILLPSFIDDLVILIKAS